MINRIKTYIALRGLTEKEFGANVGVSQQMMNYYLSGRSKMPVSVVVRILELYPDISAEWLMRGEGDMKKALGSNPMMKVYEELLNDRDRRIRELELEIAKKKISAG